VTVAKTALWIAEAQMMAETEKIIKFDDDYLPLKTYNNIAEGNALRMDWNEVCPAEELDYIIGNPPFVGGMMMTEDQKQDMHNIFGKIKGIGELDYVGCWYRKSAELMQTNNLIKAALVSTNSITQGEQVAILWESLMSEYHIHIDFAYRTFRWDSESTLKARVHCIIVGFSKGLSNNTKRLYINDESFIECTNINGYLTNAPDVFLHNQSSPLCRVPAMVFGNMPRDGGGFILSEEEKNELIANEPMSEQWIHLFLGAEEYIKNKKRYCLWLINASPADIKKCPTVYKRIEQVRNMRLESKAASTRKMAETPTLFAQITQPKGRDYIIVPRVSSEKRHYVPMGFMTPDVIASDAVQIIPDATIYHFGILTSSTHMSWMRAVCGRLEMRYRYSKDIVYNNFPWPTPTDTQKEKIEKTAQAILDARALYPDSSLADLYDDLTMPVELRRAHQANDRAVMEAYAFPSTMTESDIVARLLEMYQQLTTKD
ncbi:MAG: methylase, partial [Paludibacteraceae bacterium]|nr:methylase [Paludibacteraceae bacterium]